MEPKYHYVKIFLTLLLFFNKIYVLIIFMIKHIFIFKLITKQFSKILFSYEILLNSCIKLLEYFLKFLLNL